jgi:endonuclease/exonuclease/phosphatase family metal-dependent hydrolase
LLVRTWNLFHGNASPPERRGFLETMVKLASSDRPGVLCLQELPVWSFGELARWSGMTAVADVAQRPRFVVVPVPAELGRAVTATNHGLFRSAFTGQGNAILVDAGLRVLERRVLPLNLWSFRRRLDVGALDRLAWARERRVCQVLRVERTEGTVVVANLHGTSWSDKRLPDAELLRAATFVDGFAEPGEPVVLGGDFNVSVRSSRTLAELTSAEWGFEGPTPAGIDHVLVRGVEAGPPRRWPIERRRVDGRILSDHAPVEREVR